MKKNRILAAILAAMMLVGTVTGCGSKTQSNTIDDSTPPVMEWTRGSNTIYIDDDAEIVKHIEEKYNIDLKAWQLDPKKFNEQLAARMAGGEMPDVITLSDMSLVAQLIEGGMIHEMPIELIKEKAPNYYEQTKKHDDGSMWTQLVYNGKNYGVMQPMAVTPFSMFWNKKWLDAVGKEVPTTLEEYEDVLTAFVENDPDGNGKKDTAGMAERSFGAVFGAFGLRCVTGGNAGLKVEEMQLGEDNVPFFPWTRPEAKQALEVLRRWYEKGILDKEFITGENHGGYVWLSHSFMNGRIGLTSAQTTHYFAGPDTKNPEYWNICGKEYFALNPDGEIVIGPAPVGPNGKSGTEAWAKYGNLTFLTTKAFEDPRKVDAFFKILDDQYTDLEFAKLVGYGKKDVHYKETDIGIKRIIDGDEARKAGIMLVNFDNVDLTTAIQGEAMKFRNESAPHGYYRFNTPAVPEYLEKISTLDTITEKAYTDIITGKKPLDYFETYVEEFNKAGGSEVEKAVQEEYAKRLAAVNS